LTGGGGNPGVDRGNTRRCFSGPGREKRDNVAKKTKKTNGSAKAQNQTGIKTEKEKAGEKRTAFKKKAGGQGKNPGRRI